MAYRIKAPVKRLIVDFVVVGGGIAGLSAALRAAGNGYSVVLLGDPLGERSATIRSAGIVINTLPDPFLGWAVKSGEFYRGLEESHRFLSMAPFAWITGGPGRSLYKAMRERGLEWREVAPEEASESLGLKGLRGGDTVYLGEVMLINMRALMRSLLASLLSLNVDVIFSEGRVKGGAVVVNGMSVRGTIVVATGAWAKEVPGVKGLVLYRCEAALLKGYRLKHVIYDQISGSYVAPFWGGGVIAGDGPNPKIKAPEEGYSVSSEGLGEVMGWLASMLGWKEPRPAGFLSAPCSTSIDGYPIVGPIGEEVYVITGLGGLGITIGPALAEALIDSIRGVSRIPWELSPEREMRPRMGRGVIEPSDLEFP